MAAPSDELLPSSVPAESLSTHWRRRRRPADAEPTDGSDDSKSVVSGCWQPDEEDAEMVSGLEQIEGLRRMKVDSGRVVRRAKRLKLDLEVSSVLADSAEFNMFSDLNLVPAEASPDEHQGGALLCFLSPETFVGFVELHHEGESSRVHAQAPTRTLGDHPSRPCTPWAPCTLTHPTPSARTPSHASPSSQQGRSSRRDEARASADWI